MALASGAGRMRIVSGTFSVSHRPVGQGGASTLAAASGVGNRLRAKSQKLQILGEWFVRFQLILQFPATTTKDFDVLVALEEELTRSLRPIAKVDGHDFGMGEFNIFVLTDGPKEAFEVAKVLIQQRQPQPQLRAAYREIAEDEFVILWPLGLAKFTVA
jgi:hypothetical protein